MTLANDISTTSTALNNIKNAIIAKGVTPTGNITTYATAIGNIKTTPSGREISNGVYQIPTSSFTFSLPSNATDLGDMALCKYLIDCTSLTTVDLSSLTTISGRQSLSSAFYGCTSLTTVDLSSLTTISGTMCITSAFEGCTSLTTVDLSSLTTISGLQSINGAFYGCTSLTTVDLSSLTTISIFTASFFESCTSLNSLSFPSLTTISGENCMYQWFKNCRSLTSLSFPALTSNSFGSYTNQFNGMLTGVTGCTVHFPMELESIIGSWSDVTSGFGGTRTTILYDLNGCTVSFNITPNTNNEISVNSNVLTGNSCSLLKGSTANYQIYNSNYGLYLNTYSVPSSDTATISVDLTNLTFNTVSINTGVSGLNVTINGFSTIETSSGVYVLPVYNNTGSSITLNYFVNGGDNYVDESGVLTFNNSDISETVTMSPATISSFERPDLSSNGTLGGNSFAVRTGASTAWRAVDSSTSTYANMNSTYGYEFIFYNPDALKVSQLDLQFGATNYSITAVTLYGSNDNEKWTEINSWSGSSATSVTFTVNSTKFYKYHKLSMTPYGSAIRLSDLAITAVYKEQS